jgi:hypothetical protein
MRKYAVIVVVLAVFIVSFFILFFAGKQTILVLNVITISGTLASLLGLMIALIQIKTIKDTSNLTKEEVEKSLAHFSLLSSVSDLTKAYHIINEISTYIRAEKIEPAYFRALDLKSILIEIQNKEDIENYLDRGLYAEYITDLTIDISSFNKFLMGYKKINFLIIMNHLENISTIITDLGNKLKFKYHDRGTIKRHH